MHDICVYTMSMYVCVHIHERPILCVGPCLPLCLRQDLFVHCSISGLACELPGTLLSTSLTDACVGLALHGFSGFESIACALSTEPSLQFPKQCSQVTVALLSKCQERLVLNSYLFQYIFFPTSTEGFFIHVPHNTVSQTAIMGGILH